MKNRLRFDFHVADLHFLVFLAILTLFHLRLAGVGGGHLFAIHADLVGFLVAVAFADQHPVIAILFGEQDVVAGLVDASTFGTAGLAADGLGLGLFLFLGEGAGGK